MLGENYFSLHVIFTILHIALVGHKTNAVAAGNDTNIVRNNEFVSRSLRTDRCQEFNTCNYSRNILIPNCYCDSSCQAYNDCCFDFKISDKISQDKQIQGFSHRLECKELFGYNFGVYLISDCLNKSRVVANDGGIESRIPVTGKNSVVYKNINIAKCNNQREFNIWDVAFLFQVCEEKIDFHMLKGMSNTELANAYFKLGCEFRAIPPRDPIPRFCMNLFRNESVCNSQRLPVRSSKYARTYQNRECCSQFEQICTVCGKSDIYSDKQLYIRFGTSMTAIFQIQIRNQYQKRQPTYTETTSAKVSFQNVLFEKMIIASIIGNHDEIEISRALLFVEFCLRNTYNLDTLSMKYRVGLTSPKVSGSIGGLYLSYVDIILGEVRKPNQILDIKLWIEGINVTYTEKNEDGNTTFHIRFVPRREKARYTQSTELKRIYVDQVLGMKKDTEFLRKLTYYHDFPKSSCTEIYGQVKLLGSQMYLMIRCESDLLVRSQDTTAATVVHGMSTICLIFVPLLIIG